MTRLIVCLSSRVGERSTRLVYIQAANLSLGRGTGDASYLFINGLSGVWEHLYLLIVYSIACVRSIEVVMFNKTIL